MKTVNENKTCGCKALTQTTLSTMKEDGYSCKNEFYIYRSLTRFCEDRYEGIYSPEYGAVFLSEKCALLQTKDHQRVYQNAITRLNQTLSGNLHWKPDPVLKPYPSSCFNDVVQEYENYLKQTKKTANDIRHHVRLAAEFLAVAEEKGIFLTEKITPDIVYIAFEKTGAKESFRKIKPFFRYAHKRGLITKDLCVCVPAVSRHHPVPTVYTSGEIDAVLGSVDRTTKAGKRDYCILLLAARFGIRSSDIAGLLFDCLDYSGNIIHIIQRKTGVPIDFPLTEEVSEAIRDYLDNARPESKLPYVFLSIPRPYARPISTQAIYGIVSKYLAASGIDTHGRRRGAHALRSSLATRLLNEGADYHEVQQVLGHTSPEAATCYIRVETEKLRDCAVEVPLPGKGLLSFFEGRAVDS